MFSRSLTEEEVLALEAALAFAARISAQLRQTDAARPLRLDQLQELYDGFLAEKLDDSDAIIALGLSFGECLKASGNFEWVRCWDDDTEETCLAVSGLKVYCAPIYMIQRRLDNGEKIDLVELQIATLAAVEKQVGSGKMETRSKTSNWE